MDLSPREWMEKRGLTQTRVATLLRCSPITVNRWINERRAWPFPIVVAMKRISGDQLTDESFLAAKDRREVAAILRRGDRVLHVAGP